MEIINSLLELIKANPGNTVLVFAVIIAIILFALKIPNKFIKIIIDFIKSKGKWKTF